MKNLSFTCMYKNLKVDLNLILIRNKFDSILLLESEKDLIQVVCSIQKLTETTKNVQLLGAVLGMLAWTQST